MPRCSATTNSGKRCRLHPTASGTLCAVHSLHGDKKPAEPTLTADEIEALMQEVRDESETFLAFAREYYPLLRELYNVAGAEMAEQYIDFKRLGRGAYNDKHSKAYPNFRKLLKEY